MMRLLARSNLEALLQAPDKGQALLSIRTTAQADTALYVGSDVTDEDVFQLDQPGKMLSVRVGEVARVCGGLFLAQPA